MSRDTLRNGGARAAVVFALAGWFGPAGIAHAAEQAPAPPMSDAPADAGPDDDAQDRPVAREEMRRRLRDRLEQMRRDREMLESALRMIDEGKPLDEIRAGLPERPDRRAPRRQRPEGAESGPGDRERRPDGAPGSRPGDVFDGLGGPSPDRPGDGAMGPPGGDPDRRAPRNDPNAPVTDADRATIHDFLKATAPRMQAALEQLERADPKAAERKHREILPRVRMFTDLRERDPAAYEFRLKDIKNGRESIDAARSLAKLEREGVSPSDDRYARERERLRVALERQYDTRTEALRHELTRIRARIDSGEKEIAARPEKRAAAIDMVINLLLERERSGRARDRGTAAEEPDRRAP